MNTLFSRILQLVDRRHFNKFVSRYSGNKHVRRLSCWDQFVLLLFGQINKCGSAREALAVFNSYESTLYHLGTKEIARSTLADALSKRDSRIFEDFYKALVVQEIQEHAPESTKEMTTVIDATQILLPSCTRPDFPGANGKSSMKVHTVYCLDKKIPENAFITPSLINDIVVAKQDVEIQPGRTYVFDKGYYDFGWWWKINKSNAKFVTRLKKHTKPEFLEEYSRPKSKHIMHDHIIKLRQPVGRKRCHAYTQKLRRIVVKDQKGRELQLITNDFDRDAEAIADLYKDRWSIEIFFKWIKQNLKIKTFYGRSSNAIRAQIYVALIVYILMKKFKRRYCVNGRFIDFVRITARHLMEKQGHWWEMFFPASVKERKRRRKRDNYLNNTQLELFKKTEVQYV